MWGMGHGDGKNSREKNIKQSTNERTMKFMRFISVWSEKNWKMTWRCGDTFLWIGPSFDSVRFNDVAGKVWRMQINFLDLRARVRMGSVLYVFAIGILIHSRWRRLWRKKKSQDKSNISIFNRITSTEVEPPIVCKIMHAPHEKKNQITPSNHTFYNRLTEREMSELKIKHTKSRTNKQQQNMQNAQSIYEWT